MGDIVGRRVRASGVNPGEHLGIDRRFLLGQQEAQISLCGDNLGDRELIDQLMKRFLFRHLYPFQDYRSGL